jgi:hypothetical protein
MPKMPQPGTPLEDKLLTDIEASDTPERKAAARTYLDAERAAHKTALEQPLLEDRADRS